MLLGVVCWVVCFCFSLMVYCLYVANCVILGWLLWVIDLLFVLLAVCGVGLWLSCVCSFWVCFDCLRVCVGLICLLISLV